MQPMMAVHEKRSLRRGRGFHEADHDIGRNPVVPVWEMDVPEPELRCPVDVGLGSVDGNDRFDPELLQCREARVALRLAAGINVVGDLEQIFDAVRVNHLGRGLRRACAEQAGVGKGGEQPGRRQDAQEFQLVPKRRSKVPLWLSVGLESPDPKV